MIVDDDSQLRATLRGILENEGYKVIEAPSGLECLDMLKRGERPDIVLLDVMMPDLDGWETSKRINEDKEIKNTQIAMLTIKSQDKHKMKSLEYAKADWHIAKPIDKKKFIKTIKWILENPKSS
jgi:CheY-like chemotaxis protein